MKYLLVGFFQILLLTLPVQAQEIIIQENETGFCSVDGTVVVGSTSVTGWTGTGYADTDLGLGKSISWEIHVDTAGTKFLIWRYAIGGTQANRNARLLLNGNVERDTVFFPPTTSWSVWWFDTVEVNLNPGDYKIRIEAYSTSGLANYDYLKVTGSGVSPATCTPSYVASVRSNDTTWGTVTYEPVQAYYDRGTLITMRANPKAGYFFESWTGEATSNNSVFTFPIQGNLNAVARFLPDDTMPDSTIIGYGTVQDDSGTTYLVTGGSLGDTVEAYTVADLQSYLGSSQPHVVLFTGELTGTDVINVTSDKTLIGTGEKAHLNGIQISINQARNVIIRNITVSHVTPKDGIEINGQSKNIILDRCELFTDRTHGQDYYDGLLDIKNGSSFITVSRTTFHDHYKVCLISSGDEQVADTVIRVTFHHDYFYNCNSRLPSIRFGRAHIFNNYYKDCDDAINSRMDAWVRIEGNYFENVNSAVMTAYSSIPGRVQLIDNHFGSSTVVNTPTCDLTPPYPYQLDPTDSVPSIVTRDIKITDVQYSNDVPVEFRLYQNYPNPFNPATNFRFSISEFRLVTLKIYNILGREISVVVNNNLHPGTYTYTWDASSLPGGVYFYRLTAGSFTEVQKLTLVK